jgi:hypothetical protein
LALNKVKKMIAGKILKAQTFVALRL